MAWSGYDFVRLEDRSNIKLWNQTVESYIRDHYEVQSSTFTLVEDVLRVLKIANDEMPRNIVLQRVQAALGTQVELFGKEYFVNMRSKQNIEAPHLDPTRQQARQELELQKKQAHNGGPQITMNVTYEEACALAHFRNGDVMKGLREISKDSYMPAIVNEVRAVIASEALMYSTDTSCMLRKVHNDAIPHFDLNGLYAELSEKTPTLVKVMDFVKHSGYTPNKKQTKSQFTHEAREDIVSSIIAKALCTFNPKLDAYKRYLTSILVNHGSAGEYEVDSLAETNDTYPYKDRKKVTAGTRSNITKLTKDQSEVVVYKDKNGQSKVVNLYDLVQYDPSSGVTLDEEEEEEYALSSGSALPLEPENDQKPFIVISKQSAGGGKSRKRRRASKTVRMPPVELADNIVIPEMPLPSSSSDYDLSAITGHDFQNQGFVGNPSGFPS